MDRKYLVVCFDENKDTIMFSYTDFQTANTVFELIKQHKCHAQVDLVEVLRTYVKIG